MKFYQWVVLVACLACVACSAQPRKCPAGYHPQSAMCVPD